MIMTRSKTLKTKEDRLSGLPDEILLIIMSFIMIKDAVQTCILSKRWRNLWKFLPNLTLHSNDFKKNRVFYEFVSRIVSCSDQNHTLHSLDFYRPLYCKPKIMTNLINYAVCHNIQQLKLNVPNNFSLPACVFSCPSLTSLSISVSHNVLKRTRIPKSLQLPALLSLHLNNVPISADENGHAEPFSNCKKLNSLSIEDCVLLLPDAFVGSEILSITNTSLANLTMNFRSSRPFTTVLSTPNLSSFACDDPRWTMRWQKEGNIVIRSSWLN
ncbi:F-box protein [Glycine soja]|nr:hypothetical protein JHK86_056919 [Glycine max]